MAKTETTKKSVSFRKDVLDYAQGQADKFHGGNLSGYLTFLISMDKYGMSVATKPMEVEQVEEQVRDNVNNTNFVKSQENEDYIDSILNI